MKKITLIVLCLSLAAFAMVKTGGPGYNASAASKGTYTVLESYAVGLSTSYGLAIQDSASESIWISNWGTSTNSEFSMASGSATGTTWSITNGIDADDQAFCEYGSGNQFFFGDWTFSNIGVFDDSGSYVKGIAGPGWGQVCGVAAGHDMLYASDFFDDEIAWGTYTGTESSVSWTTAAFNTVSGLAVYGDYLFACTQNAGEDNIFIFDINSDGS
ncbi:hypothetical protein K8R78_05810, partial [bacterium]|nr:hypothetical protein [bacterium]